MRRLPARRFQAAALCAALPPALLSCLSPSLFAAQPTAVEARPGDGEAIAVRLASGRVVNGFADGQSNEVLLWLRRTVGGATLWSGFPWSQVAGWQAVTEVAAAGGSLASQETAADDKIPSDEAVAESIAANAAGSLAATSLEVHAEVANWDGDVELDGLRVVLRPVDGFSTTVPLDGQVNFKLLGQRRPWHGIRFLPPDEQFAELTQWTRRVRREDFGPHGAVYLLEFRQFHPDADFDVASWALLHARLGVAGHGVFEASQPYLFLRRFNGLRDELQQFTHDRYFRQEHVRLDARP